ncbi:hypothetical protein LY76DRAFT_579280 [Colletotrichum caudatum]|nr:hypothetical protein LY76DRAFT_579280 [Colletotrichum caudatum]
METMAAAAAEMSELQLFTKTNLEVFHQNTPKHPYITFKIGPSGLKRLVVKIWSHDQGWSEQGAVTRDPFANSHTWFSLGLFNEKTPENDATPDLYEFQRNVTASEALRCYTHEWNLGTPAREEDAGDEVDGWIESLAEASHSTIGVFPLAEDEDWENWVSKMEVLVFSRTPRGNQPHSTPQTTTTDLACHIQTPGADRQHSAAVRLVDPQEKLSMPGPHHPATLEGLDSSIHLDSAIRRIDHIIQVVRGDHRISCMLSKRLGILLWIRHSVTKSMIDLQKAIDITQQLVNATHQGHPDRVGSLHCLALRLLERYVGIRWIGDLATAINAAKQAVAAAPLDHPDWIGLVHTLGFLHGVKYSLTGAMKDLQRTTETLQRAVDATPQGYPDRYRLLLCLGIRHVDRYDRTRSMDDLQAAIKVTKESINAMHPGHSKRARNLHGVIVLLITRYRRTNEAGDLDEAIEGVQQAVSASLPDDPNRADSLAYLGKLLGERFSRKGAIGDLQRATNALQQAIATTPQDHPRRADMLNDLGCQLGDRFGWTAALEDIQQSIALLREAADTIPQGEPRRVTVLTNLGNRLGERFNRIGEIGDLQEAIEISQQAVDSMPPDYNNRAICFNNLGNRLSDRFNRIGAIEDLYKSIEMAQKAINSTPADDPERPGRLNNLANRLSLQFQRTEATEDLEKAIETAQEAVSTTPTDHPNQAMYMSNLGDHFALRFKRTGATDDLEKSIEMAQQALLRQPCNLATLLGQRSTRTGAIEDLQEAIKAGRQAVDATPTDHPNRSNRLGNLEYLLGERSRRTGVIGDLEESIDMAKQAVDATPIDHPEWAKFLIHLAKAIDLTQTSVKATPLDHPDRAERLDILASRFWEEELLEAAANGPVVVVNVSHHRCDALVVQRKGIQHCELPDLSYEVIQSNRRRVTSGSVDMLEWLWDTTVRPVLDALGLAPAASDAAWPRVWWIPTGPLVGFPLHAAGYHTAAKNKRQTALDYVISSYATSVRSVLPPHRPRPSGSGTKLVLVDMEDTPGISPSSGHAVDEVLQVEEAIRRLCTTVARPERVKRSVQTALSGCQMFHFAGHGTTDPRHPLQSRLLLTDWREDPFTVESLLQLDLKRHAPFLAYLSACGSGRVRDDQSVDESIHLSSACQLAGFRHVIGTLWSVDDALCAEMAKLVYGVLVERGLCDESVSHALHWASRQLRDAWADPPNKIRDGIVVETVELGNPLWVPYVHYGP